MRLFGITRSERQRAFPLQRGGLGWGLSYGIIKIMNNNINLARKLRKNSTPQEKILWQIFRNHTFYGYEIRRQSPIGKYIVDFVCKEKKIIIEIDGGQHNTQKNILLDEERTQYLMSKGYKVIRFWNNEVTGNIDGVYKKLQQEFGICD